ncbi:MAG TPA: Ig-like domain-containing protein [Gemmatimonadales bacterium]|nr:Ig-like domain-containing protein [Gemmatimonadales bacterium]
MNFRHLCISATAAVLSAVQPLVGQNVAEVQVAPAAVSIKVGERTGLLATAFDRIGNVIPTAKITWTSRSPQVARVDANGTVTGTGNGVAIIEAASGRRTGLSTITVSGTAPAPVATQTPASQPASTPGSSAATTTTAQPEQPGVDPFYGQPAGTGNATALRIVPAQIFLLPSENTRVGLRALKDDGSAAAPVRVTWNSLTPTIASIDHNGTVVALSPGQGTIQVTAAAGGLTATAPVVVQQADMAIDQTGPIMMSPGDADTLHVVVPTQGNRVVSPLQMQWGSSVPAVATVTLDGVLRAVGPGDAVLQVQGLLQNKTVAIHVHKTVETLAVSPPLAKDVEIPLAATTKFVAHPLATGGVPVPEAPLRWIVGDSSLASFDTATGMLTGLKVGKTTLTVRGPGVGLQAVWNISVIAGSVRLSASRAGLHAGQRFTIKADFTDDGGQVLGPATGLTWQTDAAGVAIVTAQGDVTAMGYGRARITATAPGGKSSSTVVFVQGELVVALDRGGKNHLFSLERSSLTELRRVTNDSGPEVEPAFSSDGSRIVFVSTRDGIAQLYLMDADGTNRLRLTNRQQPDSRPVFAPDGQTVVFQSTREGKKDGLEQIWSVNVDGTGLKVLTDSGGNRQPSVSPDGQTIAFISNRDNKTPHVWLMNRDGTNQRAFIRGGAQREVEPHFLKDGSLAFLVQRKDNGRDVTQVMKADLASGTITPLSGTDLAIFGFGISPSGDMLALLVNAEGRRGHLQLYVQPVGATGAAAAVPVPIAPNEQMLSPTFLPQP